MDIFFPEDFEWGTATASYQIEGAVSEAGKGESIWDRFTHIPGNIADGTNGDVACDFYHRYEEDLQLAAKTGIQVYRLSISWPRIIPDGTGAPKKSGIDFYIRVLKKIKELGMKAAVTMYHWDLPQKLQERGGWANPDSVMWFCNYAKILYENLGTYVDYWITLNEPFCTAFLGYWTGEHAPGYHDYSMAILVVHHLILAHGMAVQEYRKTGLKAEIGITLNMNCCYPADGRDAGSRQAAALAQMQSVELFCDPILLGIYPEELMSFLEKQGICIPEVTEQERQLLGQKIDFLGINMYHSSFVEFDETAWPLYGKEVFTGRRRTAADWEVTPEGIREILQYVNDRYHPDKIIITENGAACNDWVTADGKVHDVNRIEFLKEYLKEVARACMDGIPVKGYYVWCFCDNFEWAWGLNRRFGMVYVDYATQERIPKDSLLWYGNVIKNHGFSE